MITFTQETSYTPLDAWSTFTALCLHFNPERDYDAIKYKFKGPRCDPAKFEAHKQKFFFEKLVKKYPNKNDFIGYCVANALENKTWINDTSDDIYTQWQGRIQALDYNFVSDINAWGESIPDELEFDSCIVPPNPADLPFIYIQYKRGEIKLETLAILEILVRYIDKLNTTLSDPMKVAYNISHKIKQYSPFLVQNMNVKKYTDTIINAFTNE